MVFICKERKEQFTDSTILSFDSFFLLFVSQETKDGLQVYVCCFIAVRDVSIFPSQTPQKRRKQEKGYEFTFSSLISK